MEKPSIRIPHPAPFWFVVICLGIGACAFLVLAVIRALCGDFLNVFLCLPPRRSSSPACALRCA